MGSRYSCFEIVGAAAAAGAFFVTRDEECAGTICAPVSLPHGEMKKPHVEKGLKCMNLLKLWAIPSLKKGPEQLFTRAFGARFTKGAMQPINKKDDGYGAI